MASTEKIPLKVSEKQTLFNSLVDSHIGKLVCIRQQIFWSSRGADEESNKICLLIKRLSMNSPAPTRNRGYAVAGDADWKSENPKVFVEALVDGQIAYLTLSQLFVEFLP